MEIDLGALAYQGELWRVVDHQFAVIFRAAAADQGMERALQLAKGFALWHIVHFAIGDEDGAGKTVLRDIGHGPGKGCEGPRAIMAVFAAGGDGGNAQFSVGQGRDALLQLRHRLIGLRQAVGHVLAGGMIDHKHSNVAQGLAFVLILGVFIVMLRSIGAGLIAMIPNIIPISVVFGVVSWMGQRIDIGSMITASIALGIAVDGTLHYLTWIQLAMRKGRTRHEAIVEALVHCGPAMWQTSAAVAVGLLVLVPAELLLISRFGWLMASMIGVALLGDIVLMPQLLGGPLGWLFEPGKPRRELPAVNVESEVVAIDTDVTTTLESGAVPTPHIKPHVPVPRKRRTTTRRDPDEPKFSP